jgi:hypothetical protein
MPKHSFSFAVDYLKENGLFGIMEMTGKDKFYFSDSHNEISEPYHFFPKNILIMVLPIFLSKPSFVVGVPSARAID